MVAQIGLQSRSAKVMDRYPTRVSGSSGQPEFIYRNEPTVWGSHSSAGMFGAQELAAHERNGFVSVPDLLSPTEVAGFQAELDRLATDPVVRADQRTIIEKTAEEVRSIFEVHKISDAIATLAADERVGGRAQQILGSPVYLHQARINYKPGFTGGGFYWHSDFETWHAEDGMPQMRAVSVSISLTENRPQNGCLMIMSGSHKTFVPCVGETPGEHYRSSLREQEIGIPDQVSLSTLADRHEIVSVTGPAGAATFFDSNCMHGSSNNITPYSRSNIFLVFNSVDNALLEPFAAPKRRPTYIATRDIIPVP